MNNLEFALLSEDEKIACIMQEGKLLARKLSAGATHFLYQLHGIYVCTCYEDAGSSVTISVFDNLQDILSRFQNSPAKSDPACRVVDLAEK